MLGDVEDRVEVKRMGGESLVWLRRRYMVECKVGLQGKGKSIWVRSYL